MTTMPGGQIWGNLFQGGIFFVLKTKGDSWWIKFYITIYSAMFQKEVFFSHCMCHIGSVMRRKVKTVHLQLYICWKITIMGTMLSQVVKTCKHRASALTMLLVNWVLHLAKNTVYINQFSNQSIDYMVIATKRVAWDHKVWWHLLIKLSKKDTKSSPSQ